jgi:hypothetical protein
LTQTNEAVREFDGEELFLIQGKLNELHTARTSAELMREIDLRTREQASARPAAKMHALLSGADAPLFAEGEDLYNFAGMVGADVLCGVFADANRLESGDKIVAVVSRRSGVLYAHSVKRNSDHLLLLPQHALAGQAALFRRCMQFAWRMTIFLWILFGIGQVVYNWMNPDSGQSYLFDFLVTLLAPPLLMFTTEFLTYRKMGDAGAYASAIFEVYRIPYPDSFDAVTGMDVYNRDSDTFFAMNADKAIKKHLKRFKMSA